MDTDKDKLTKGEKEKENKEGIPSKTKDEEKQQLTDKADNKSKPDKKVKADKSEKSDKKKKTKDTNESKSKKTQSKQDTSSVQPGRAKLCNGLCCYKTFSMLYAFFFFFIGLLLLGMGLWIIKMKASFEAINNLLGLPAILALVVGITMVIVAVLGLIGALREHLCLLKFFLAIIILVFILEIVIGVIAFIYRERTVEMSSNQMKFAVKGYLDDDDLKGSVDYIQEKLDCCGLSGPSDWDFNGNYSCANRDSSLSCSLPLSCCMEPSPDCLGGDSVRRRITSSRLNKHGINTTGCSYVFLSWMEDHLDALGATAMGFALLHVLGIFIVYMYIGKVEDYSKLYKYRKRIYEVE